MGDRPPEVIVLTTFDADENVLRALRAGASGFLLKDAPPARITEAIRRVAAGDPIFSPNITRRLMALASSEGASQDQARARSTPSAPESTRLSLPSPKASQTLRSPTSSP